MVAQYERTVAGSGRRGCAVHSTLIEDMSATANPAYRELIDFLAGGTTPEALIAFRPSEAVEERVSSLIEQEKEGQLAEEDQQELADYLQLEHMMIMAKAQARWKLQLGV